MSSAINHFYRFGEFTVDSDQKVLLQHGKPLPLTPKVFETLLILVNNSGRIVEKEELMSRLWPDTFVEESNLTFNIQQLRKAFRDNARHPKFIETVARRGYRFIADVQEGTAPSVTTDESRDANPEVSLPPARRSYLSFAAISVLLIGLVAITAWFARGRLNASAKSTSILSTPFKSEKLGIGEHAVITPDGKYVAYTRETGGKWTIWLRQLETSENIQIVPPSDQTYLGLVVSHDGNSLYFVRKTLTDPATSAIFRVMTFGGIPVKITEQTEGAGAVSLSPDDKQLAFTRCKYKDDDFCSLMLIDTDGQNERKLLTRQRPIRLSGTQLSPDGKSIAFASGESWSGGSNFRLMRLDLASGAESQISRKTFFDITNLKWLPDGDGLLLAAKESRDGRLRIWHVSAETGETQPLTNDATNYISLSLDRLANRMVATHTSDTFRLYIARIDDVSNPQSLAVARVGVSFAPEGRIVYEANDGDIWTINRDGGEQRQLTNSPFSDFQPRMSPDSRYIFFTSNRSGSSQVWRMNVDGTDQVQLTKREGGYPVFVTPDGRWLYFESGLHQTLWRVSTEGGDETEVSKGIIQNPAFSRDGTFVAYFFRDEADNRLKIGLMLVERRTVSRIFALPDNTYYKGSIAWKNDNKSFYYVTINGSQNFLWLQSLDNNPPQLIGNLGSGEIPHLALSPDENTFTFIRGKYMREAVLIEGLK